MPQLPARLVAAATATAGASLLGLSLGGMASVDRDLAAASGAPARTERIVAMTAPPERWVVAAPARHADCPDPGPRSGARPSEL